MIRIYIYIDGRKGVPSMAKDEGLHGFLGVVRLETAESGNCEHHSTQAIALNTNI